MKRLLVRLDSDTVSIVALKAVGLSIASFYRLCLDFDTDFLIGLADLVLPRLGFVMLSLTAGTILVGTDFSFAV